MGRGRTEVWPHPAHSFSHPPCTPRTPLTWHHVSVREQTALLSVTGSNFLLPSSVPPSFLPLPHTLFFPSLPCLLLFLFCFHKQQRDAKVKAGDILPLSGREKKKKKKGSSPSHPSFHWNWQHTDTCTWCTHSFTLASSFVLQQCPCAYHEAVCHDSLLISHTSTFRKTQTPSQPQNWLSNAHLSTSHWEVFSQTLKATSHSCLD